MGVAKAYKDIKRLDHVVNILFKHELGYIIDSLKLKSLLPVSKRTRSEKFAPNPSMPRALRLSMEDIGATFIKLGQLLSLRPDLIPKEYCKEFSLLQDDVRPIPFKDIKQIVEAELKKPINEIFIYFNETPLASASIGQVHKAKLKNNDIVAIKVQRPNIKELFDADIDILYHIAALIEHHFPHFNEIKAADIVKEFERYTKNELDYTLEAGNIDIFYNNFRRNKMIKIPKVYWELTTQKVLTMEFINGKKIDVLANFTALKSSKREILKNLVNSFIEQTIEYGSFHADPHPGNILLLGSNKIALLDFGIIGKVNQDIRENIESTFIALVKPDKEMLIDSLIQLGFIESDANMQSLKHDLSQHIGKYYSASLREINISELIYDVLALTRKYKIKFPVNFILLLKAIITLEGLGKELNPNFNFVAETKPILDKLIKKRSSLVYILKAWREKVIKTSIDATKIPEETRLTLKKLREGNIKIKIDDPDIKKFAYEVDKSSNRLTFGLLIAGLAIASAILALAKIPPLYNNIPILSIVLLIITGLFIIFLFISILKERGVMK